MNDLLLTARARQVIAEVAGRHHVTPQDLDTPSHEIVYVRARQVAMYALRKGLHLSLPMIGRLLHRDHSTVLHGIGVVEGNLLLRQEAWAVIGAFPPVQPADLSDTALRNFVADLDAKIAIAKGLRRMLGGPAVGHAGHEGREAYQASTVHRPGEPPPGGLDPTTEVHPEESHRHGNAGSPT